VTGLLVGLIVSCSVIGSSTYLRGFLTIVVYEAFEGVCLSASCRLCITFRSSSLFLCRFLSSRKACASVAPNSPLKLTENSLVAFVIFEEVVTFGMVSSTDLHCLSVIVEYGEFGGACLSASRRLCSTGCSSFFFWCRFSSSRKACESAAPNSPFELTAKLISLVAFAIFEEAVTVCGVRRSLTLNQGDGLIYDENLLIVLEKFVGNLVALLSIMLSSSPLDAAPEAFATST